MLGGKCSTVAVMVLALMARHGASAQETWMTGAAIDPARVGAGAVCIGLYVYVFGGQSGCPGEMSVHRYAPATGVWTVMTPMREARWGFAIAAAGGSAYIIGGETLGAVTSTVWRYTPALEGTPEGPWKTDLNPIGFPGPAVGIAANPTAAELDGDIYLFGGRTAGSVSPCAAASWSPTAATWRYDPETDTWEPRAPVPSGAGGGLAAARTGSRIYVLGGEGSPTFRSSLLAYDPATDTWDASLPAYPPGGVAGHAMAGYGQYLYVAGGLIDTYGPATAQAWRFDLAAAAWAPIAPLPRVVSAASGAACRDAWYVVGGSTGYGGNAVLDTHILQLQPELRLPGAPAVDCEAVVPIELWCWDPVRGFSFAVQYDPSIARLVQIELGSVFSFVGAPDVFDAALITESCEPGAAGMTLGCVISLDGSRTIPAGRHEVARLVFRREATDRAKRCGAAPLAFRGECFGSPPVALEVVTAAGGLVPATSSAVLSAQGSCFVRGDADNTGKLTIADAVAIIYHRFRGELIACLDAGDGDDDGLGPDLADAIHVIAYLFRHGPPPPPPFPGSGADPTADGLTCEPCA